MKINEKVPPTKDKYYVVYKYRQLRDTFIVSFDSDVKADEFQKSLLKKPDICRCEIFGHLPKEFDKKSK